MALIQHLVKLKQLSLALQLTLFNGSISNLFCKSSPQKLSSYPLYMKCLIFRDGLDVMIFLVLASHFIIIVCQQQ